MDINFTAPVNSSGYGVTAREIIKGLVWAGHQVAWWPIGSVEAPSDDAPILNSCLRRREFYKESAPSLRLYHQFDMAQHTGRGKRIGWPIFELDCFTSVERHHLDSQDHLIVCSNWARDICQRYLSLPVDVVPLGVDRSVFKERPLPSVDQTIFINIGKWEVRKGHDVLLKAFEKAFSPTDDVKLFLCCDNIFLKDAQQYNQSWRTYYQSSKMAQAGKITLLDRVSSQENLASLMSWAHCGVFPSKAEGWNLEIPEMLSMGRHIIATNYSAHTEYLNDENSRLIEINDTEDAFDGIWFHKQGRWAKFGDSQMDQLIEHMRAVHKSRKEGSLGLNTAGIETAKQFTWENSVKILEGVIRG